MARSRSRIHPAQVRSLIALVAPALLGSLVLTGCGTMTTAPLPPSTARLSPANSALSAAPVRMPNDPGEPGSGDGGSSPGPAAALSSGVASSVLTSFASHPGMRNVTSQGADISAAGGSLTNGCWRVDVPANAFAGPVHVTLSVAGARGAACQVQLAPAGAAPSLPLTLTASCRTHGTANFATWTLLAFDSTTAQWTPVDGATSNRKQHTVGGSVSDAGVYGVGTASGKAAW